MTDDILHQGQVERGIDPSPRLGLAVLAAVRALPGRWGPRVGRGRIALTFIVAVRVEYAIMGLPTGPDTDRWPLVKAKWFTDVASTRAVRLVVIHTMEVPEKDNMAENVARNFANLGPKRKASAHLCIDNNSIVQSVQDNDVAFAAPGANRDGIHLELAGYARQTSAEWDDAYSDALLENAANAAAQYCLKYDLPRRHLTDKELGAGAEGIIGHVQATDVFKKGTHTDPGKNFPWTRFIGRVQFHYAQRRLALGLPPAAHP